MTTIEALLKKKRDELVEVQAQIPDSIGFGLIELEAQEKCLTSFISELEGLVGSEWVEINYNNVPKGEVLLLTTSMTILKGDWYKNNIVNNWGWRTERSRWEFTAPEGVEALTLTTKEEITHYSPLPSAPIVKPLK